MSIRTSGFALMVLLLLASLNACVHQVVPLKVRPSDVNLNADRYVGKRVGNYRCGGGSDDRHEPSDGFRFVLAANWCLG